MADDHHTTTGADPFTPVTSDADWEAKGWAAEPEPLSAAPRLGSVISIQLDPDDAALVHEAARASNLTRAEFVRRSALAEAARVIQQIQAQEDRRSTA